MISVVIPTYNRRELVLEAVRSVLAQEVPRFELIVVDDGSTDGTADVLAGVSGVRCLRCAHRGVSAARNDGVAASAGEWIAFLDSDDFWKPGKLAAQERFHKEHPDLRISQTEEIWIRRGRRVNPCKHHRKPEGDIFLPSLERCLVSPSAVFLRRDLFESVGGFDESLPACEDYDLWLRIAAGGDRFGLVREPLVVKRGGRPDQISLSVPALDRFRVRALVRLIEEYSLDEVRRRAVAETLVRKCGILAQGASRRGRYDEAERYRLLAERFAGGPAVKSFPGEAACPPPDSGREAGGHV